MRKREEDLEGVRRRVFSDRAQWRRGEGLRESKKKGSVNMMDSVRVERTSGRAGAGRGS